MQFLMTLNKLQFQADATVNLLNRLSCTTYDVEIREIVSLKINS